MPPIFIDDLPGATCFSDETMARFWKKQRSGFPLDPAWTYHVYVCGFTFKFTSVTQIGEYLEFYSRKIHPTSRLPDCAWVEYEARRDPRRARKRIDQFIQAERDCIQRWWERLPFYLQKESKRQRVVKALAAALDYFTGEPRRPRRSGP